MTDCVDSDFGTYLLVECHLSKPTIDAYCNDVAHFKSFASNQCIETANVISFLAALKAHDYAKSSIVRKVSSLRMYFYYLKHKKKQQVPDIGDVFKANQSLKLPKIIRQDNLEKVVGHTFENSKTPLRDQCMVAMLYYAGCRVSEVVSMKKNHLFLEHMIIQGKGGKERMVPLASVVKKKLNAYLQHERNNATSEWLFPGRKKRPLTRQTVTNVLAKLTMDTGVSERLTPHMLRHMFATTLLDRGMDLREVQLLLGHASITTTQMYTHLNKSKLRRVYQACHPLS